MQKKLWKSQENLIVPLTCRSRGQRWVGSFVHPEIECLWRAGDWWAWYLNQLGRASAWCLQRHTPVSKLSDIGMLEDETDLCDPPGCLGYCCVQGVVLGAILYQSQTTAESKRQSIWLCQNLVQYLMPKPQGEWVNSVVISTAECCCIVGGSNFKQHTQPDFSMLSVCHTNRDHKSDKQLEVIIFCACLLQEYFWNAVMLFAPRFVQCWAKPYGKFQYFNVWGIFFS